MNQHDTPAKVASTDGLGMPVAAYESDENVQIVACKQRDGSRLWAVRDNTGWVLNKQGEWEPEPQPSNRDDAFLTRCRYATPLEARNAHMRYLHAYAEAHGRAVARTVQPLVGSLDSE
jgi:hypothetical protein